MHVTGNDVATSLIVLLRHDSSSICRGRARRDDHFRNPARSQSAEKSQNVRPHLIHVHTPCRVSIVFAIVMCVSAPWSSFCASCMFAGNADSIAKLLPH